MTFNFSFQNKLLTCHVFTFKSCHQQHKSFLQITHQTQNISNIVFQQQKFKNYLLTLKFLKSHFDPQIFSKLFFNPKIKIKKIAQRPLRSQKCYFLICQNKMVFPSKIIKSQNDCFLILKTLILCVLVILLCPFA